MTISQVMEKLIPEKPVRLYLVLLALLFAAMFMAGLSATDPSLQRMTKTLVDLMQAPIEEMAGGSFFLLLLLNNVFVSLLLMFTGIFGGVIPLFLVVANGFVTGMVYRHMLESSGAKHAALDMVPQSVFGVPALLIVAAYGIWLGVGSIRRLRNKGEHTVRELVSIALQRYITLVFPLLIAAAATETLMMLRGG